MTEAPKEEGVCLSEQKIPHLHPPPLCPHRSPWKLGVVHTPLWAHVNVYVGGYISTSDQTLQTPTSSTLF